MKFFRFADIPLENFACPPEIIAANRYIEANIGNFHDDDDDKADDCNICIYLWMDYDVLCTYCAIVFCFPPWLAIFLP